MSHVMMLQGDARTLPLQAGSIQCCVTSPPYWQLRRYLHTDDPLRQHELGQESLHDCAGAFTGVNCGECYICHLRAVFRDVWRVLRDDGVMFIVIADTYAANRSYQVPDGKWTDVGNSAPARVPPGLRAKSLCGIPQRLALALCADGWIWRSEIIWAKSNGMPESVGDRPTRSHEQVLMFSKSPRYFFDLDAIGESASSPIRLREKQNGESAVDTKQRGFGSHCGTLGATRHARDVWTLSSESYSGQHFAVFPQALATRCILAGTPQAGCCPACRTPWERQMETLRESSWARRKSDGHISGSLTLSRAQQKQGSLSSKADRDAGGFGLPRVQQTTGFACACDAGPAVPALVLDPFSGAGTTVLAARALGRACIGVELSATFLALSRERLELTALAQWQGETAPRVATSYTDLPLFAAGEDMP